MTTAWSFPLIFPILVSLSVGFFSVIVRRLLKRKPPKTEASVRTIQESDTERKFRAHILQQRSRLSSPVREPYNGANALVLTSNTTASINELVPAATDQAARTQAFAPAPSPAVRTNNCGDAVSVPAATELVAETEPGSSPAAESVKELPPFVFLESVVTCESSGKILSDTLVARGQTRLEKLVFQVNTSLIGLTRHVTSYKQFPLVGYQKVGSEALPMGNYGPQLSTPQSFDMPKARIPNMVLAKGKYRIDLRYTAHSHPGVVLTHIKHEFEVV